MCAPVRAKQYCPQKSSGSSRRAKNLAGLQDQTLLSGGILNHTENSKGKSGSEPEKKRNEEFVGIYVRKANIFSVGCCQCGFRRSFGCATQKPAELLLQLPLSFEENRGQTDSSVKFVARGDGYALFLTHDSAVFKFGASGKQPSPDAVRMKLVGVQPANISTRETLPGKVNYFIGNDPRKWRSGIATYGKVEYAHIYQGIDLAYYGNQRQLEYDFVVAPGADPRQIALEFSGAKPKLGANGELQLVLDSAPLTFRKPVIYQNINGKKELIAGEYTLTGDRVQFALGPYDHSQPLVIDPVLDYLTYLGGAGGGQNTVIGYSQTQCAQCNPGNPAQGVAVDTAGNLYVTGYTESTAFPVQGPPAQSPYQSTDNQIHPNNPTAFVTEINPTGTALVYSTYLGGSIWDTGSAIAVDSNGSAYVTGRTYSNDFPVTQGAYQTLCAVAPTPTSPGTGSCSPNAGNSAFLTKLAPGGGSLVYSTFLGGGSDTSNAVAVDSQGQAYIAGTSGDTLCSSSLTYYCFPETVNALIPDSRGNDPAAAFVAVFDSTGSHLLYSTLFGDQNPSTNPNIGNNPTIGTGVAVDPSGNFYLTGFTQDPNLPTTPGAFQATSSTLQTTGQWNYRGFVAKFGPVTGIGTGASQIYGTYLGGTSTSEPDYGNEQVSGIAADSSGNAYVTGLTQSYDFPTTAGANNTNACWTSTTPGFCQSVAFLSKLNPLGTGLVWSTLVGGPPAVGSNGTAFNIGAPRVDAGGNVYVTGRGAYNYPVVNPIQPASQNNGVFATKYDPSGSMIEFSTLIYTPANAALYPGGMDVDAQGNIYLGGYSNNAYDLQTTAGAFQTTDPSGGYTGFLAKLKFENSLIELGIAPNSVIFGTQVTFTATLTGVSGNPMPTGTVNFLNGATVLGSGAVDSTGAATFSSGSLAPGSYSVTAAYQGDGVYGPATSTPPMALTINPVTTTARVTIASSPSGLTFTAAARVAAPAERRPPRSSGRPARPAWSRLPLRRLGQPGRNTYSPPGPTDQPQTRARSRRLPRLRRIRRTSRRNIS